MDRLSYYPSLAPLAPFLRRTFDLLSLLPRYLIPKYFEIVIRRIWTVAKSQALSLMSPFVRNSDDPFIHALALGGFFLFFSFLFWLNL